MRRRSLSSRPARAGRAGPARGRRRRRSCRRPADQRHERREVELASDLDRVRDRLRQRERPPEVVEPGGERRRSPCAPSRSKSSLDEAARFARSRAVRPDALLVGQVGAVDACFARPRRAASSAASRRRRPSASRRVEVEVDADRAPFSARKPASSRRASQLTVPAMSLRPLLALTRGSSIAIDRAHWPLGRNSTGRAFV